MLSVLLCLGFTKNFTVPFVPVVNLLFRLGLQTTEAAAAGSKDLVVDFRSRFFAPRAGIAEDPVTGSAHCMLGPYWMQKLGRGAEREIVGFQASPRGGIVKCIVRSGRVTLSGPAVTTLEGTMYCG